MIVIIVFLNEVADYPPGEKEYDVGVDDPSVVAKCFKPL